MKGLIIKDLFALKRQAKVLLVMMLFYIIYSAAVKNLTMLGGMIMLICTMMPITTMSYDEFWKWDGYALSMPISRKTIVMGKYVFSLILNILGCVIVGLISVVMVLVSKQGSISDVLLTTLALGEIAFLFLTIIFPILFKFGVEKGRFLMILVLLIPSLMIMLLPRITTISEDLINTLILISPVILVLITYISIKISVKIYSKKEF